MSGLQTAVKKQAQWLIVVTILLAIIMLWGVRVKENYTDLHYRVRQMEIRLGINE